MLGRRMRDLLRSCRERIIVKQLTPLVWPQFMIVSYRSQKRPPHISTVQVSNNPRKQYHNVTLASDVGQFV